MHISVNKSDIEERRLAMLRRVVLVRTDVSEERSASIRVTWIVELGTLAVN
jgi:hypothetical protein